MVRGRGCGGGHGCRGGSHLHPSAIPPARGSSLPAPSTLAANPSQVAPLWYLAQLTFNMSLLSTSVTSNTILSSTSALFTFLFSLWLLAEVFTLMKLGSIGLLIAGAGLGRAAAGTHPLLLLLVLLLWWARRADGVIMPVTPGRASGGGARGAVWVALSRAARQAASPPHHHRLDASAAIGPWSVSAMAAGTAMVTLADSQVSQGGGGGSNSSSVAGDLLCLLSAVIYGAYTGGA